MPDRLCLTIEQAADELQISQSLAYSMAKKGELPAIKISQRRWVVPLSQLQAWLAAKAAGGAKNG